MLKTYTWPDLDHSEEARGQDQPFLALSTPGRETDIISAFQDMNDRFALPANQGSTAIAKARFDDADMAAAHAEGVKVAHAFGASDRQLQAQEIERLTTLLARQETRLVAHRQEVEAVSKNLISCLLDILGQGGLRIDEKAWCEALGILRQALAPDACTIFSSSQPIPGRLAQDGEAFQIDDAIAIGEIHATDGKRTFALSLMDLA